jgi:hypothetical protein
MIRFACPACNAVMEGPPHKVGQKIACLKCGQRLKIPPPPRGTILAQPLPSKPNPGLMQPPAGSRPQATPQRAAPRRQPQQAAPSPPPQEIADPAPSSEVPALPSTPPRIRKTVVVVWCISLAAVGTVVAGVVLLALGGSIGGSSAGPSTPRAVAEHLQTKGMLIRSSEFVYKYPAVVVCSRDQDAQYVAVAVASGRGQLAQYGAVMIVQFPSSSEAHEAAVTMAPAFSWGNFMFAGDRRLLDEIQSKL